MAMTYDDYIKDAEAKKNKTTSYYDSATNEALASYTNQMQLQKDYAQGVYDRGVSYAEGMKNTAYTAAEQQRAQAERDAEISYQRQAADAQAARYLDSAYYGAKGEQIARMGLGTSGYSDYLESRAYQTSRAEAQAAAQQRDAIGRNARDAEAGAKLNADMTYNNYMNTAANDRDKAFADADLTYSQNALAAQQAAREGKMNAETQYFIDLANARDKVDAQNDKNISNYATYLQMVKSGDYSKGELDKFANMFGIDGNSADADTTYNDANDQKIINRINAGAYEEASDLIDELYFDAKMDTDDRLKKYELVADTIVSKANDSNIEATKNYLDQIRETIGEQSYQSYMQKLKNKYGVSSTNGNQYGFADTDGKSKAWLNINGKYSQYDYSSAGTVDEDTAKKLNLVGAKNGYLASYGGNYYIYIGDTWRKIDLDVAAKQYLFDTKKNTYSGYSNSSNTTKGMQNIQKAFDRLQ